MSSTLRQHDGKIPGMRQQWVAHDKPGGQAAQRRLRQQAAIHAKQRRTVAGVEVDANGRTPAGLIVPGMEPRQRVQRKPRWS